MAGTPRVAAVRHLDSDKLYSTVVNAVRNYQYAFTYEGVLGLASWLILQTHESTVHGIRDMNAILTRRDGTQPEGIQFHFCILTDRESITVGNFTGREGEARTLRDRLAKEPARVLNSNGDRFVHSGNHMLISLARTDDAPVFDVIGETNYRPLPDHILRAILLHTQCIRNQMAMIKHRYE